MDGSLSETERQRIAEFASTPKYKRSPEMLLPEGATLNDDTTTDE